MKKLAWILPIFLLTTNLVGSEPSKTAVTSLAECSANSKYGKQETENMQKLEQQMQSLIKDSEEKFTEILTKLRDPDHLDGLSPTAQKELESKAQMLSEEMNKYRAQYQQVMQQSYMQVQNKMMERVKAASAAISEKNGFTNVLFKEHCAAFRPEDDITALVLEEMDKAFDIENPPAVPAEEQK